MQEEQSEHEQIVTALEKRGQRRVGRTVAKAHLSRQGLAHGDIAGQMKIAKIEAIPVRLPREREKAVRTAGSPTARVDGSGDYRWS
jgi:hypothetical protein